MVNSDLGNLIQQTGFKPKKIANEIIEVKTEDKDGSEKIRYINKKRRKMDVYETVKQNLRNHESNQENLMSYDVLEDFRNDNFMMSGFVKDLVK